MNTDMPEVVVIEADEAYFDSLEDSSDERWTDPGVRAPIERQSRYLAYTTVWEAARKSPNALLADCRKLLAEIVDISGDGITSSGGLGSTVIRDARRLVQHIDEVLPAADEVEN